MVISLHPLPFFIWVWIAVRERRRNLAQGAGSAKTGTDYPNIINAPEEIEIMKRCSFIIPALRNASIFPQDTFHDKNI